MELPTNSINHFLSVLGLIIIYGGASYSWKNIERLDGQEIMFKVSKYESSLIDELYEDKIENLTT